MLRLNSPTGTEIWLNSLLPKQWNEEPFLMIQLCYPPELKEGWMSYLGSGLGDNKE